MARAKRSKRPRPLDDGQRAIVVERLRTLDAAWWRSRVTLPKGRQELGKELGFAISRRVFRRLVGEACRYFVLTRRRGRLSRTVCLSADEWAALARTVRRLKDQLVGRSLDEAVGIVSLHCPTNHRQLSGLMSDLHFWNAVQKGAS